MYGIRFYIVFLLLWLIPLRGYGQYFGQNKPSYRTFDFNLSRTEHFDIYHYLEDTSRVQFIANLSEQWHAYHRQILHHTFSDRDPIIFYRNHADFQQTTAIMSRVGVGTGGVTEGLKRRVVMPFSFSDYQTAHVLGHELVHAFQYNLIQQSGDLRLNAITRVPLWMTEGMAEYLSVGNIDAFTCVWMRDALLNDDFPTFDKMGRGAGYSPYRFGQAFWSFIASRYGEQYIQRLFLATARQGYQQAFTEILGITPDSLDIAWRKNLSDQLLSPSDSTYTIIGERLLSKKNAGHYNLSPSVSPDEKYLVFLSERDVYSLDLFLADAQTGEIIRKIYTSSRYSAIDDLEYTETAGTWSPDNRFYAFVGYQKGSSVIIIFDVKKNEIYKTLDPEPLDAVASPVWSPGGEGIAFSGMTNGTSNIYYYNLEDRTTRALTRSSHACIQPSWTSSGKHLWFVTDQDSPGQSMLFPGFYNLARVHFSTGQTEVFSTFQGARNLNPVPLPDREEILFLSNVNGHRDLYALNPLTSQISRVTRYATGVMGITEMSPALSVGNNSVYYSRLWDGEFQIIKAPTHLLLNNSVKIPPSPFDYRSARLAPYSKHLSAVEQNLVHDGILSPPRVKTESKEPKRNFKLDYVGNMAAGVMSGRFGTGMAGSIEALFSDILGHNLLFTGASINGEIYDFGGQAALLNQKRRVKTGVSISHVPYRMGYYSYEESDGEEEMVYYRRRIFEDKGSLFAYLPLNKSTRFESGVSLAHYEYRYEKMEEIRTYYPTYSESGTKIEAPDPFWVGKGDVAWVFDNSRFGMASPVDGTRSRIQFEKLFNGVEAHAFLFDYRKYRFVRPFSFAFRFYHYGRYGADRNTNRMTRLFAGYPWLVRGYDTSNFYADSTRDNRAISIKHLTGSNLLVTNLEWRMPLTGPIDLAWQHSSILFSELALFIDAGLAWNNKSEPAFSLTTTTDNKRVPVFSTGLAVRFNILGFIVIEPYYAFPFHQKRFFNGQFGFNVFPGW